MKTRNWTKVVVETPRELIDEISRILIDYGSSHGVEVAEGETAHVTGYFQEQTIEDMLALENNIQDLASKKKVEIPFHVSPFANQDWVKNSSAHCKPVPISDKLLIVPEWEKEAAQNDPRQVLVLTPGMAFGTGHHETTFGVLECMVSICKENVPKRMLDVGCGSGILSIAGSLLGIPNITAFDVDSEAVKIAAENTCENGLEGKVKYFAGEISGVKGKYDLIVANIISGVLKDIREEIRDRLMCGGKVILAGILREQAYQIRRLYLSHTMMRFVERKELGEWVIFVFEKVKLPHKYPCPGCEFCQFCSDTRCDACRMRLECKRE